MISSEPQNILLPNLVWWCSIMSQSVMCKKNCLLLSRSRSLWGFIWSKYYSFYYIFWTAGKLYFDGRFPAEKAFGRLRVSSCIPVGGHKSIFWCADCTALWTGEGLGWRWLRGCILFSPPVAFLCLSASNLWLAFLTDECHLHAKNKWIAFWLRAIPVCPRLLWLIM